MARKIDPKFMKQTNKKMILKYLIESGPMSRSQLVNHTKLANSAVWRIVQELESEGIISRKSYSEKTATKNAALFGPSRSFACSIVLDVQVTQSTVAVGFLDKSWKIIESFETNGLEKFLQETDKVLKKLVSDQIVDRSKTILSISVPGVVNEEGTILFRAPNLNWRDINLLETFSKYGLQVIADNDANLSLLAEWFFSEDVKRSQNAFFLYFGEGVGGSLIINGKIVKGKNFAAGEVGHTILDVSGLDYVEVESLLSISRLIDRFEKHTKQWQNGGLKKKFEKFIQKWRAGDKFAKELVEEFTDAVAVTLLNIGYTINPEVIVFGGVINNLWETFGNILSNKLNKLDKYEFLKGISFRDTIFKEISPSLVGCNVAAIERFITII